MAEPLGILNTHQRDWFSLKLFNALNISTTTNTVIDTVDGCRSSNMLQGYNVSLVEQLSKFIWKEMQPISIPELYKGKTPILVCIRLESPKTACLLFLQNSRDPVSKRCRKNTYFEPTDWVNNLNQNYTELHRHYSN